MLCWGVGKLTAENVWSSSGIFHLQYDGGIWSSNALREVVVYLVPTEAGRREGRGGV